MDYVGYKKFLEHGKAVPVTGSDKTLCIQTMHPEKKGRKCVWIYVYTRENKR